MEGPKRENIVTTWLLWHFMEMPVFLFSVWKNYLVFGLDFFSTPFLLATMFSPWGKYAWNYPKNFSITEYIGIFISNVFSRVVGAFCRLLLIIIGIFAQIFIFTAGIFLMLCWILLPFILAGLVILFYAI